MRFVPGCMLAAFLVIGAASAAFAEDVPRPSSSPSAPPEIGRVVTSDRRSEPIGATSRPTFVVDRRTIENLGARTVADALSGVPGVNLFSYGAFGAQTDYGIRGTTAPQTLVLRDGVPIIAGSNGTVDLGTLSTIGVQRIEIVESGSSTLYGTNAVGGVINLITGTPAQPLLRVAAGGLGESDVAADASAGRFSAAFERRTAANGYAYPALPYTSGGTFPAGVRANSDAQQTALRVAYTLPMGDQWLLKLSGFDDAIRSGVPGSLQFLTPDARQGALRTEAALNLERTTARTALTLTLAGAGQQLAYADPRNGGESDTYDGRAQASLRYAASLGRTDWVTGIDAARESAALSLGPAGPPPSFGASEAQTAVYGQLGYALGTARLIAGLRGENDAPRGSVAAPSFGAVVPLGPVRLAANVGESFRAPTLIDLYYPNLSNPNLRPEKLTNYDATIELPNLAGGVSLGYFGRNGSNLITVDQQTFVPFNAAQPSVAGLQLTVATKPRYHLRLTASVTDVYRALDLATGARLPRTPALGTTLGLERPFDGGPIAFGLRGVVVGSNNQNGPNPVSQLDNYALADAYVRYRLDRGLVASLRVRNLGDQRYAPIYGYPAPGRTFSFELATR
jgi:vitamin B12 transporter